MLAFGVIIFLITITVLWWFVERAWRRRRFERLDWPPNLDNFKLSQAARHYLSTEGWTLHPLDDMGIQFRASKANLRIQFRCKCETETLLTTYRQDLGNDIVIAPCAYILICLTKPPAWFKEILLELGATAVWYKELADFSALVSTATIRHSELLEKTRFAL